MKSITRIIAAPAVVAAAFTGCVSTANAATDTGSHLARRNPPPTHAYATFPHLTFGYHNEGRRGYQIYVYTARGLTFQGHAMRKTGRWGATGLSASNSDVNPYTDCFNVSGGELCGIQAQSFLHPAEHLDMDFTWKDTPCVVRLWKNHGRTNTVNCYGHTRTL